MADGRTPLLSRLPPPSGIRPLLSDRLGVLRLSAPRRREIGAKLLGAVLWPVAAWQMANGRTPFAHVCHPPSDIRPLFSGLVVGLRLAAPRRREVGAKLLGVVLWPVAGRSRLDSPALLQRPRVYGIEP